MDYKVGDILQLTDEGIRRFAFGCQNWRWQYIGLHSKLDRWGEPCLSARRIDIKSGRTEFWSPRFLEKAKQ